MGTEKSTNDALDVTDYMVVDGDVSVLIGCFVGELASQKLTDSTQIVNDVITRNG